MTSAIAIDQTPEEIGRARHASVSQFDSALFGPPSLLAGENHGEYTALFQAISTDVQPGDFFEHSSVRHMTDLLWEVRRYRRIIAQIINASEQQGLEKVLRQLVQPDSMHELLSGADKSHDLARRCTLKEGPAVAEVDGLLASAGLGWDAIKAEAAALRTIEIDRLNRLVMTAEARMNSNLRNLERRRADLAKRLRSAVQQAQTVDAGQVSGQLSAGEVEPRQAGNSADLRLVA